MGKIRTKKSVSRSRASSAGLPTSEELKVAEETSPLLSQHILQRLTHSDCVERKWACQSLSHLLLDHTHRTELMKGRVVRRLTPLFLDNDLEVREAATGALRNMSCVEDERVNEHMVSEDIMTPLSALIRDSLTGLDAGKEADKDEKMIDDRKLLHNIVEESLCLLWNLSETSRLVLEVFNRESLLPLVLQLLLHFSQYPPSLSLTAAQLLHVVTEDNQDAIQSISSSPSTLAHLESLLTLTLPDDTSGRGQMLLLRAAVSGIFQNLLPALPDSVRESTLRGLLDVIGGVVGVDHTHFLTETNTDSQGVGLILSAQELACELLANICYTEGDDEDEWEDCGSVESGGVEEMEASQSPVSHDLPSLTLIVESQMITKVSSLFISSCSVFEKCPKSLNKKLTALISTTLLTLQNMISSLPVEVWSDYMTNNVWPVLFNLPSGYTDNTYPVVGLFIALASKLDLTTLLTEEQLRRVCEMGVAVEEVGVRADIMRLLGSLARTALDDPSTHLVLLELVGSALRECVTKDPSLWVVSQALDSIFDIFGSDNVPPHLYQSLSLHSVLQQTASTFTARLRVEKKSLGTQLTLVQSAKVNLPRFVSYMASKQ